MSEMAALRVVHPDQPAGLRISADLLLPEEAVTETFAILGKRGKGKTATGVVLTEELIRADLPVVVLDPIGVWWGLRSDATGEGPGLPVVIFGGDHADVPLDPGAGQLVADVVVDERVPAVLDLSALSKTQSRRLVTDFLERLYHRNRDALHVVVDEADAFAPQRAHAEGARLLGAMEDLVRRGRARGLGVTLITQRPAVLNKDVLTQAEVLVALGMTGPRDVAAIDEWVRLHADEDQAREVKASLPSLPVGTAWWWSPGWLDLLQRVQVRRRATFDSSATPKPGETRRTVKRMADVDLARIGERMAAAVAQAEENDPRILRRRIADLERAAAARPAAEPERVEVPVEVPVLDRAVVDELAARVREMREAGQALLAAAEAIDGRLSAAASSRIVGEVRTEPAQAPVVAAVREQRPRTPRPAQVDTSRLPKAQATLLRVLVQHARPLTAQQLAVLSGYSIKSSGFANALGALRSAGLAVGGRDAITATRDGVVAAGDVPPLPTGRDLVEHWAGQLGKAPAVLLRLLVDTWPNAMSADELAEASGYSRTSSGFANALGRLRGLGLVHGGRDAITASDELN